MWSVDGRARGEYAIGWSFSTRSCTPGPVLKATLNEADPDEHDSGTSDDGREDLEHDLGWEERDEDFKQSTYSGRAEDGSITLRAGQLVTICICWAEAIVVHLGKGTSGNRNDGERNSHDRNEAGTNVVTGANVSMRPNWTSYFAANTYGVL